MISGMGRPKTVWHDLPPRMCARANKKGSVRYYYQAKGKKLPLGTDLEAAKLEWARLESGSARTFPAIAKLYRAAIYEGLAKSTKAHYEIALRHLELTFRKWTLDQIEPAEVKRYMRKRTKKAAAFFEKRVLSAMFNWARGEGYTSVPNPCHGVTFSRSERKSFGVGKRTRYVTDAEFDEVHGKGDAILQDAMDLALLTAQRPSDILSLTRHDIKEGVLWIVQAKTGKKMGVRVEGDLQRVLQRILERPRRIPSIYLIADRRGQRVRYNALNSRFIKAVGEADWQFRDIRAKAATDSPDLKSAQQLLGHANEVITAGVYRRSKSPIVSPLTR